MPIDDGGPAFPVPASEAKSEYGVPIGNGYGPGMSLRDYFAAAALQGVLAAHSTEGEDFPADKVLSRWCYGYADAMLAQRTKEPT